MSQLADLNPWLTMWAQPRGTIRSLVHNKPSYGVFYLAAIYALENFFFYANWWSFGLNISFFTILLTGIILCPFIGFVWLYFIGWIFHFSGRWLKGTAPAAHLRTALAWSKIPAVINLLMWFILIFVSPDVVFIQDGGGTSSLFVNFIAFILAVWSFVLLIQGIREVQGFSVGRSLANVLIAGAISSILLIIAFGLFRYFYMASV